MEGHPGAGRVSSAKDKAEFIKEASIRYAVIVGGEVPTDLEVDEKVAKALISSVIDIAEMHWDELKRRGYA